MGPVCTLMVGRLDDWLKVLHDKHNLSVDPGYLEWAGVAVFKKAYKIYRQRGYRLRLLSAAFRNHMHWSELIGGDVVISPPCAWQRRYNESDIEVIPRIDNPVDPRIVDTLLSKFPDFERAYSENGLTPAEFDTFGSTRRTSASSSPPSSEMNSIVRDSQSSPNPDTDASGIALQPSFALLQPHLRVARRNRAQPLLQQLFHFLHRLDQPAAHHRQIAEIARTRSSIFGATSAGKISSACTGVFLSWFDNRVHRARCPAETSVESRTARWPARAAADRGALK